MSVLKIAASLAAIAAGAVVVHSQLSKKDSEPIDGPDKVGQMVAQVFDDVLDGIHSVASLALGFVEQLRENHAEPAAKSAATE